MKTPLQKAKNLSNTAMWMGILSVVLAFAYYLIPMGIVFSIVAILTGSAGRRRYYADPENIPAAHARNATIGWIAGIAGLCISIIWGVWYLIPELIGS